MDLIIAKLQKFDKALLTFERIVEFDLEDEIYRDSAIQRFEYTIDTFWKLLKVFLVDKHKFKAKSPREIFKMSCSYGLMSDEESEFVLIMLDYRNKTSHDYALEIADEVAEKLPRLADLMRKVYDKINDQ